MDWKILLALYHGVGGPRTPARHEYLTTENRILRQQIAGEREALSRHILSGERARGHALIEYVTHVHEGRPYQGKGNVVLRLSRHHCAERQGPIRCRER
jgi:hypothetical protein